MGQSGSTTNTWGLRLRATFFWSVIAAAFIGPGTVTTAASAGSNFGLSLLWSLLFSVFATIVLQETAARISQASGMGLGSLIAKRYADSGRWLSRMLFVTIAIGCAAYQAGNMLGAVAGLKLLWPVQNHWAIVLGGLVAGLLWSGNHRKITFWLGIAVALMGMAFIVVGFGSGVRHEEVMAGLVPGVTDEVMPVVMALIGTTIVPYNLFLASGLRHRQQLSDMRWGIALSVIFGGIITFAILLAGRQVSGSFSFEALAAAMSGQLGNWGGIAVGFGLLAAGFTSAVTAPLAAAVTAQALFGDTGTGSWSGRSWAFRSVWISILLIGTVLASLQIKPIPAIIAAQAMNAVVLPLAAIFTFLAANDRKLLSIAANGPTANAFSIVIIGLTSFLALYQLHLAVAAVWPQLKPQQYEVHAGIAFIVAVALWVKIWKTAKKGIRIIQ
jgi:Mn2+/Fe2+ NRAMP family transporter